MKITEKYLQSLIARVEYHRVPDSTVTLASLILHNGFAVNGESACINPADFDEKIGQEIAYKNAFEQLWKLEGYRIKAETEPLEQTWQGRLLLEYHQLQARTEKLHQFLSTNPEHEAATILREQYYAMRQYLAVLQKRVAALDETTHPVPPALEPDDKDVVFVKVNDSEVYGIADATKHFADLLLGYNSSTAQISLLESDDAIIGSDANGNQKNLIEMLAISKASWKERHGKCWTGEPLLICRIDEED